MKNMDKQSDLVNPKSIEDCGNHAHTDDEFEEHSEGEMLSEDEPNEDGSSDEESADSCGEEYDDADSCAEGSNEEDSEELEEVLEEDNEEDEEEISKLSEEKPNRKEALRCSMDQISPVNDSDDVPSLLEEKKSSDAVVDVPQVPGKRRCSEWDVNDEDVILVNDSGCLGKKSETRLCAGDVVNCSGEESHQEDSDEEFEEEFEEYSEDDDSVKETNEEEINKEPTTSCSMDQLLVNKPSKLLEEEKASVNLSASTVVDVPRASSKRRPSRWDIKAEDLVPVNDSGNLDKREIECSSDVKVKSSVLMNDSADLNKRRKTRWSSDKSPLDIPRPTQQRNSRKVEKRLQWLNTKLQMVNSNLEHYLKAKENLEKQTSSSQAIDDVHLAKLLQDKNHFVYQIHRMNEAKIKTKLHQESYKFKKLLALPMKEDSRYNLAALIIGPNGKTLNDMEKKTGAKLSLRGKDGSYRRNISKWEDIHLMIKANSHESIDAAVSMIQDLWQHKKHIKAAQLKELAKIKGTLREEKIEFVWTKCDICGDMYHPASDCPLTATDAETVKKFHTGPGSLFSSFGDKDKCATRIMPAELVVNCMPPISNDKNLVVGVPAPSAPSPNANLPSYPGHSVVHPSSWNANLPNYPGLAVTPSTSNANAPSYREVATISPSSSANLTSYHGHATAPPSSSMSRGPASLPSSSSNTNLSTRHVPHVIPPASSEANLQSYPAVTAVPPSSNTNLPSFPGFVVPPFSSNANRPSFPGIASIHPPPFSNINRSSYPQIAANPPAFSNTNVPSHPRFTAATPSSSNSNLSSYTGLAAIPPLSSNAKPPNFPDCTAVLPSSSNANLPSYTRFAPVPPSNANLAIRTGVAAIPQEISKSNNWPGPPGSSLPESSSSFLKSGYNSFSATSRGIAVPNCWPQPTGPTLAESGASFPKNSCNSSKYSETMRLQTSTPPGSTGQPSSSSSQFPGVTAISKELASFTGYTGLAAIPQKAPLSNNWPAPPFPLVPKSGSSFFKSSYSSPVQSGSARFQSSASPGKNADILDGKKLGLAVTATPPPPSNPNSRNYSNLAAIPPELPERNFWPRPTVSTLPESGMPLPGSIYSSLNYSETRQLPSSAPLGYTGQTTVSSSHLPDAVSNELANFPGYPKRVDASYPFDRSVPSSSLSSQPAHFTSNFSGNQMNPAWRNYNHPTSN